MDGSSVGSPSTSATHVARTDCPHLADPDWEALQRLSTDIGEEAVATMPRTLSPTEQQGVALGYIMREQHEVAAAKPVSPGETSRWADKRRLTDPTCFSTYEYFKEELKLALEPSQNEYRARAEFSDLQQGNQDVHAYAQQAQYLVSNVVTDPMDEATKVVTFMEGLRDGPVKTYLFREYLSTLETVITRVLSKLRLPSPCKKKFSLRQVKLHTNVSLPPRPAAKTEGPEPMDLSYASAVGRQKKESQRVMLLVRQHRRLCTRVYDTSTLGPRSKW
ncbi:hypothetical protein PHMEG_00037715 [Phytophthora megakarya]|uniref:Retrotransposon gag domain-containing protein n=1 Tax=Phytophthora megakarya TaxID=4795 RepID=A0A225UIU4_9STRA|nr:hypothetical protein PHMEG_00037715 [Phytophthora megakarya]